MYCIDILILVQQKFFVELCCYTNVYFAFSLRMLDSAKVDCVNVLIF